MGNRLASLKDSYTYNNINQLLTTKNCKYEYDKNGNLTKKTEISDDGKQGFFSFTYDYENRLIQAQIKEEGEVKTIGFAYDPFGRRIRKAVEEKETGKTESKTTNYVYDNDDIILEYSAKKEGNESKEEVTRHCHGPGIDEPISVERNNEVYYYHYDGLGSIVALTDQNQKIIETYDYDSFGNFKRQGDKAKNAFTYTGREFDRETGLYYYRARYYDPKIGRFITQDPIGILDDINLYAYVRNNPINWIDPWGLRNKYVKFKNTHYRHYT